MARKKRRRTAHVPSATLSLREVLLAFARPVSADRAERKIEALLGVESAVLFTSARGAIAAAIHAASTEPSVAIPAYTCVAVPNAVVSADRRPLYVDVDDRGLVPPESWPVGCLLILQDTYGLRAEAPVERSFIRDAAHGAHSLQLDGARVVVTSFEHSKCLSAGRGGLAITDDPVLGESMRELRDGQPGPPPRLRHTLVTLATLLMGRLDYRGFRTAAGLFRRVAYHLAVDRLRGQSPSELAGLGVDPELLGRPDGTSAMLILGQLRRAAGIGSHRERIVSIYDREAGVERSPEPLLRYPLLSDDPHEFERRLLEVGWDVRGRWFAGPLHPPTTDVAALGYELGSAPVAERLARTVVNLPTHPLVRERDARDLVRAALSAGARPVR
jgi:dTDP-4-amino-4,6-dideoxygalactose transaminase